MQGGPRTNRKWMFTRGFSDEVSVAYKNLCHIIRKVAGEAENLHYRHMFDSKVNSMEKLWENLNTLCSF